jgi:tRNA dimethylallyltransferase
MTLPQIHIIAGPTASGKSKVALARAKELGGVIINADSQQVYRDFPILTARPTTEEEAEVPHKLYGFMGADETYSSGKWLRMAQMEIDWARSQGHPAIIVGGTGLYIKALMEGMAEMPDIDPSVRIQATSDYEQMGKEAFAERLRHVDPQFFNRLKLYDKQRLIRAYEVWLGSGKPLSWWQDQKTNAPYSAAEIALQTVDISREELYRRCDARFLAMVAQGAVEEVRENLAFAGQVKIIGARELAAYIRGETSLEAAVTLAQQATRNYAKRQMTWFRNQLVKRH